MTTVEIGGATGQLVLGVGFAGACAAGDGSALDDARSSSGHGGGAGSDVTLTTGGSGGGSQPDGSAGGDPNLANKPRPKPRPGEPEPPPEVQSGAD